MYICLYGICMIVYIHTDIAKGSISLKVRSLGVGGWSILMSLQFL